MTKKILASACACALILAAAGARADDGYAGLIAGSKGSPGAVLPDIVAPSDKGSGPGSLVYQKYQQHQQDLADLREQNRAELQEKRAALREEKEEALESGGDSGGGRKKSDDDTDDADATPDTVSGDGYSYQP